MTTQVSTEISGDCYHIDPVRRCITQIKTLEYASLKSFPHHKTKDGVVWEMGGDGAFTFYDQEYDNHQFKFTKRNPLVLQGSCYVTGLVTQGVTSDYVIFGFQGDIDTCVIFED